jgi:hypothetical protein
MASATSCRRRFSRLGLAIGIALAYAFPALRKRMALANGICGVALIVAAGALLVVG